MMQTSDNEDSGSITADMSTTSSKDNDNSRQGKSSALKKRKGRGTTIKDISDTEKREKAKNFDLDGDGILDEAELAMMKYDVDGDGNLTATEVHG